MTDAELADELVRRLNDLITDEAVRRNLSILIDDRITCSALLTEHPTVQVKVEEDGTATLGMLGVLNGLVGVGPNKQGLIRVVKDRGGWLLRFERT